MSQFLFRDFVDSIIKFNCCFKMALIDYIPFQCYSIQLDNIELIPVDPEVTYIIFFVNVNEEVIKFFCRKNPLDELVYNREITIRWEHIKNVTITEGGERNRVVIDFITKCEYTICELVVKDDVLHKLESTLALMLVRLQGKRYGRTEKEARESIRILSIVEDSDFGMEEDMMRSSSGIIPSSYQTIEESQKIYAAASEEFERTFERTPYVVEDTPPATQEDPEANVIPCTPAELENRPLIPERTLKFFEDFLGTQDEYPEHFDCFETESERAASPLSEGEFGGIVVPETDCEDTQSNCSDDELDDYVEKTLTNLKNIVHSSQEAEVVAASGKFDVISVNEIKDNSVQIVQDEREKYVYYDDFFECPPELTESDEPGCSIEELISRSEIVLMDDAAPQEIPPEDNEFEKIGFEDILQEVVPTEQDGKQGIRNLIEFIDELSQALSDSLEENQSDGREEQKKTPKKNLKTTQNKGKAKTPTPTKGPSKIPIKRSSKTVQPTQLMENDEMKKKLKPQNGRNKAETEDKTPKRKISKTSDETPTQFLKNVELQKKSKTNLQPETKINENKSPKRKLSKTSDETPTQFLKNVELQKKLKTNLPEAKINENKTPTRKLSKTSDETPTHLLKNIELQKKLKTNFQPEAKMNENKTLTRKLSNSSDEIPLYLLKNEEQKKKLKTNQKDLQPEAKIDENKTPTRKLSKISEEIPTHPLKNVELQKKKLKTNLIDVLPQSEAEIRENKTPTRELSKTLEELTMNQELQKKNSKVIQNNRQHEAEREENKTPTRKSKTLAKSKKNEKWQMKHFELTPTNTPKELPAQTENFEKIQNTKPKMKKTENTPETKKQKAKGNKQNKPEDPRQNHQTAIEPIVGAEINNLTKELPRQLPRKLKLPTTPSRNRKSYPQSPRQSKKRFADSDSDEWTPHGIIKYKKLRRSVAILDDDPQTESFFSLYSRGATLTKTRTRVVTRSNRFCDELNYNSEAEARQRLVSPSCDSYGSDDDYIKSVINRDTDNESQKSYKPKESIIVKNLTQSTFSMSSSKASTPKTPRRRLSYAPKFALNEEPNGNKCSLSFTFVKNEEEFMKSFQENLSETTVGLRTDTSSEAAEIEAQPTTSQPQDAPEVNLQDAPEINLQDAPEINLQDAPELNLQNAPEINLQNALEFNLQNALEFNLQNAPEFNLQNALEINLQNAPEFNPQNAPEFNPQNAPEFNLQNGESQSSELKSSSNEDIPATDPSNRPYKPFPIFTSQSSSYNNSSPETKKNIFATKNTPTKRETKKAKLMEAKVAFRRKALQSNAPKRSVVKSNKLPPVVLSDLTSPDLDLPNINELNCQPYMFQDVPDSQESEATIARREVKIRELVDKINKTFGKNISEKQFYLLAIEVFTMCLKCIHNLKHLKHLLLLNFNKIYYYILRFKIIEQ